MCGIGDCQTGQCLPRWLGRIPEERWRLSSRYRWHQICIHLAWHWTLSGCDWSAGKTIRKYYKKKKNYGDSLEKCWIMPSEWEVWLLRKGLGTPLCNLCVDPPQCPGSCHTEGEEELGSRGEELRTLKPERCPSLETCLRCETNTICNLILFLF